MSNLNFSPVKKDGKPCYQETTISLSSDQKAYLTLMDLFLRPADVLGEAFDNIFPEEWDANYRDYHSEMTKTRGFLPWNGWLFRGQSDSSYNLSTTFERLCMGKPFFKDLAVIEAGMLRDFRRSVSAFYPEFRTFDERDKYEYMAHFQHFGGATRFLDVSFSFFIALFFAIYSLNFEKSQIDKKDEGKRTCALWCFNRMWIEKKYQSFLPPEIKEMYDEYDKFGKDRRSKRARL